MKFSKFETFFRRLLNVKTIFMLHHFDHYVAKMGSGVNWDKWTIFGPTDSTGPFIWHISQHTTTATSPIIVYNDQKKSKNSIRHEKISKSKNFFFPWRNPVPSLRLYFWSGLWVSYDRIITRSNCFTGSVERNLV